MFHVPVLTPGIYSGNSSLMDDLSDLCVEEVVIDTSQLANLCYKFLICYILEDPSHLTRKISEDETVSLYYKAIDIVSKKNNTGLKQETDKRIWKCRYQIEMIMDIPATMEIVGEVIRLIEGLEGDSFVGWDLGSGSGILMLAQYISARRRGKNNLEITGFELSESAINRGNPILRSLGIGTIVTGNTARICTYQGRKLPNFISSESLPTTGVPFHAVNMDSDRWECEPFIENIDALQEILGKDILIAIPFFPSGLEWGNIKDRVTTRYKSSDLFGLDKMKLLAHMGKTETSRYIFPSKITIDGVWKSLNKLGTKYRDIMNLGRTHYPHRWDILTNEELEGIYLKASVEDRI